MVENPNKLVVGGYLRSMTEELTIITIEKISSEVIVVCGLTAQGTRKVFELSLGLRRTIPSGGRDIYVH